MSGLTEYFGLGPNGKEGRGPWILLRICELLSSQSMEYCANKRPGGINGVSTASLPIATLSV